MSNNLALNKPANASSYVSPFTAQRAVDGNTAPVCRWVCAAVPAWLEVDLGAACWIERWVVKHMGIAGWSSPHYNMVNYELQGSLDNATWFHMDAVNSNAASATDRAIALTQARFVRVHVSSGLNTNPGVASIAEFEVYGTQSLLSNLVVRAGRAALPINPAFNPTIFNYSTSAANTIPSVLITPTAQNSQASITVNGQPVSSGENSPPINLNVGQNTITVIVSSAGDDNKIYSIDIAKAG